jgi:hypothetical protein
MAWEDIHVDDYGWVGKLTLKQDGVAVDISSYTTRQYILKDPAGTTAEKVATFDTDGTDGVLAYTIADGDIDSSGVWHVQARISKTGVELTADPLAFSVAERID